MIQLTLPGDSRAPLNVLCLGAHADDIEIGCGGTILQLLSARPNVHVSWVVFSGNAEREREAQAGAALFLERAASRRVMVRDFRDGYFPRLGAEMKEFMESVKQEVEPDLIFTHFRDDRHQDHRTISDLTWNTWRRHLVLEYEIPKYDGDLGAPNCFVPLPQSICARKAALICQVFRSEARKGWMTEDTFEALLRLRGIECAAPDKHAEAFHCRKLVLST
ncbi:PIG-L deacetylase family protein [Ramlibacter rhizophilus]|uniref:PIG-L family deacetylase n=1 Tax=Ramlibacter rhizophilus TaxID=1781167 RepID=A0A4Z0BG48_9BURK|nr:PIG-L deacetylase family protein [Ramlibacter rhizophilus]TFY96868.1 PIG-L family deacetylase [Ramlibacter rhizophilus]